MKKILISVVFVLFAITGFAQKREVQTASNYLRAGKLDKALAAIDKAIVHEQTMNDPRAWFYKGNILLQIHETKEPAYASLVENPLDKALEAYTKAVQLDTKRQYFLELYENVRVMVNMFYDRGANEYKSSNFEVSSLEFEKAYQSGLLIEYFDTASYYYSGLAALKAKSNEKALIVFNKLVEINYENPDLYVFIAAAYGAINSNEKEFEFLQIGRKKWPDHFDLLIGETNYYLKIGDADKAQQNLNVAIEKDPDNPSLYFAAGTTFNKVYDDTLSTITLETKLAAYEKAAEAYIKALNIDPDFFDANYNLGALYFNEGIRIFSEAEKELSKTMNFKKYEQEEIKFKEIWKTSQPYLEKALSLIDATNPTYINAVQSLRELYARTNQTEKLQQINEIWESLQK